ncbi:hypothetical protein DFH06DRAFT_1331809 [Mycena polygramma]|nr:hypothetical protein DFH06DRAFT_1331809 [Mycena polygramma]
MPGVLTDTSTSCLIPYNATVLRSPRRRSTSVRGTASLVPRDRDLIVQCFVHRCAPLEKLLPQKKLVTSLLIRTPRPPHIVPQLDSSALRSSQCASPLSSSRSLIAVLYARAGACRHPIEELRHIVELRHVEQLSHLDVDGSESLPYIGDLIIEDLPVKESSHGVAEAEDNADSLGYGQSVKRCEVQPASRPVTEARPLRVPRSLSRPASIPSRNSTMSWSLAASTSHESLPGPPIRWGHREPPIEDLLVKESSRAVEDNVGSLDDGRPVKPASHTAPSSRPTLFSPLTVSRVRVFAPPRSSRSRRPDTDIVASVSLPSPALVARAVVVAIQSHDHSGAAEEAGGGVERIAKKAMSGRARPRSHTLPSAHGLARSPFRPDGDTARLTTVRVGCALSHIFSYPRPKALLERLCISAQDMLIHLPSPP